MNKRQHKKIMSNLVSKIVADMKHPRSQLKTTRAERKLFRKEYAKVKYLVIKVLKNTDGWVGDETTKT